jgi:hypothetical protein
MVRSIKTGTPSFHKFAFNISQCILSLVLADNEIFIVGSVFLLAFRPHFIKAKILLLLLYTIIID